MRATFRLLLAFALAAPAAGARGPAPAGYTATAPADTARPYLVPAEGTDRKRVTALPVGAEIGGFLSSLGLPPRPGRFVVSDTGLVFRSSDGRVAQIYPLIGPVRVRDGRRWRAPTISVAYADSAAERPVYVFRVDGGVFGTEAPGPLLDLAGRPEWLDSVAWREGRPDRPLVSTTDSAGIRRITRDIEHSAYADSLYALFGRPARPVGLVGPSGRKAGRLGEYIASRDSLALDPPRITSEEQLRHAVAHELAHRWQAQAPAQLRALWRDVPPIPDSRRYGYGNSSEHQAEAIAFAVHFLQVTAVPDGTEALPLLDHYEVLVPGTGAMVRHLVLHPIYAGHPLRQRLTVGSQAS